MATIRDVAEYSGLSVATISKYLNGGPVKAQNRQKIQDAIRALDYQVNPYARSLKTRKSMSVGVLLPSMITPFFINMVLSLDSILRRRGYNSLVCFYGPDHGLEREKFQFLVNAGVDGLIYAPEHITYEEYADLMVGHSIPVILADRLIAGIQADAVLVDSASAVQAAVQQLLSQGRQKIAFINGPETVYTAKERMSGYLRGLSQAGVQYDPQLVRSGDYTFSTGYRCLHELMALPQPPDAIIMSNYDLTLGAITAAHELSIRIPEQTALYGFDCKDVCGIMVPPIPVILQPEAEIGKLAAEYLLQRLNGFDGEPRITRLKATSENF